MIGAFFGVISSMRRAAVKRPSPLAAPPAGDWAYESVTLRNRDSASSYGVWRNVAIVIGRQPPQAESIHNYRKVVEDLIAEYPKGVGLLTIVRSTSTPDAQAREELVAMFRTLWRRLSCIAFVMEAEGFVAATQRAIGSALISAIGASGRVLINSQLEKVTPWMAARLCPEGGADDVQWKLQAAASYFSKRENSP
jgi:hypothetical protein